MLNERQKKLAQVLGNSDSFFEYMELVKDRIADIRYGNFTQETRVAVIGAIDELVISPCKIYTGRAEGEEETFI